MILGFTGTRLGPRPAQTAAIRRFVAALQPTRLVHGGAPGADMIAHGIAESLGVPEFEIHPADINRVWYEAPSMRHPPSVVYPPLPPLDRNRAIVKRVWGMLACPKSEDEDWGSGSWATIRYAREIGCPVYVILSDGRIVRDAAQRSSR